MVTRRARISLMEEAKPNTCILISLPDHTAEITKEEVSLDV